MVKKKKRDIPVFDLPIIETHCHLDYLKNQSIEETLEKMQAVGVKKCITISVSPDNLDQVIQIANTHENVFTTQGIHPHQAHSWNNEVLQKIRANLAHDKVIAVGEIGLDYHYNKSPKDIQVEAFRTQLQLAAQFELPVVIHSRDADEDTIKILQELAPKMKKKGVIHSFTSTEKLAKVALDLGFCLGFNGIITFKNAVDVQEIVKICPIERILLETDSPFLTPTPYRGIENAPFYLPFVAEKIAELKDIPVDEVLKKALQNTEKTFGLTV